MSESRPHTVLIIGGIAIATLISTITGIAIGQAINTVNSQAGRSRPNTIQAPQQVSPTITQDPAQAQPIPLPETPPVAVLQDPTQAQPVSPRAIFPVETPTQAQPNSPTQTENCANPDDLDSRGRRCGKRSAYDRGATTGYD